MRSGWSRPIRLDRRSGGFEKVVLATGRCQLDHVVDLLALGPLAGAGGGAQRPELSHKFLLGFIVEDAPMSVSAAQALVVGIGGDETERFVEAVHLAGAELSETPDGVLPLPFENAGDETLGKAGLEIL